MAEAPKAKDKDKGRDDKPQSPPPKVCGVVMPIAQMEPYRPEHWTEVYQLIKEAAGDAGFEARIVSDSPEVGVIQRRIVQNLYDDEVVVCDVSGKNPNVMFELGLRLAFDKPTIIIQDDLTKAPFDTNIIEYIEYPNQLRYHAIIEFKAKLTAKIAATTNKASVDPNYSTFLKHFGEFRPSKIAESELSDSAYIIRELQALREEMKTTRVRTAASTPRLGGSGMNVILDLTNLNDEDAEELIAAVGRRNFIFHVERGEGGRRVLRIPGSVSTLGTAISTFIEQANLTSRAIETPFGYDFLPF